MDTERELPLARNCQSTTTRSLHATYRRHTCIIWDTRAAWNYIGFLLLLIEMPVQGLSTRRHSVFAVQHQRGDIWNSPKGRQRDGEMKGGREEREREMEKAGAKDSTAQWGRECERVKISHPLKYCNVLLWRDCPLWLQGAAPCDEHGHACCGRKMKIWWENQRVEECV